LVTEGSSGHVEPFRLGRGRTVVTSLVWLALIAIAILPLLALLAASLAPALGVPLRFGTVTLENYRFALLQHDATIRAFGNRFILALIPAAASAAVAVPLAYLATLRSNPVASPLDFIADAPYAVPGTVLAIAIILVFLPPLPFTQISLYGTLWIILV